MKYINILLFILALTGCGSSRSTLELKNRTRVSNKLEEKDSTHLYRSNDLSMQINANEVIIRRTVQFKKTPDGILYPSSIIDEKIDRSKNKQEKNSSTEELNTEQLKRQNQEANSEMNLNQEKVKRETSIFEQMAGLLWALFAVFVLVGGYLLLRKFRII